MAGLMPTGSNTSAFDALTFDIIFSGFQSDFATVPSACAAGFGVATMMNVSASEPASLLTWPRDRRVGDLVALAVDDLDLAALDLLLEALDQALPEVVVLVEDRDLGASASPP